VDGCNPEPLPLSDFIAGPNEPWANQQHVVSEVSKYCTCNPYMGLMTQGCSTPGSSPHQASNCPCIVAREERLVEQTHTLERALLDLGGVLLTLAWKTTSGLGGTLQTVVCEHCQPPRRIAELQLGLGGLASSEKDSLTDCEAV
jgi:hypothetical protein